MARIVSLHGAMVVSALVFLAFPVRAELWTIASPENNIHCEVGDEPGRAQLLCNIFKRSGPLPQPKPADCDQSWGHAYFITERGPVRMACYPAWEPDGWRGNDQFIAGEISDFGGVTCAPTGNTLECHNLDGHGFYLSETSQQLF